MGNINYNTLRPFSKLKQIGLPRLVMPTKALNGNIEGKTFQYQPTDAPVFWKNGGNLIDYDKYELLYTINEHGFRGNDIIQTDSMLMTAGCSHTYGIGVRGNEVWGSQLAEQLGMYHINIGVGGIGVDTVSLLIKQFFDEGIIPDTLAVLWPVSNRKLFISDERTSLDDDILNFLVHPTENKPSIYQFTPGNTPPEIEDLKSSVKGYLFQTNQQNLFDFWIQREFVIAMCESHNVKLIEGFTEKETLNYIETNCNKNIPRSKFFEANDSKDPFDWARDAMHFGIKAHTNIANKFASTHK